MIFYIDMVADMFHYGHVNALRSIYKLKSSENILLVGVHSDKTVESYKRLPIMTMDERISVLESCKYVDRIVKDAPLKITKNFIKNNNISFVFSPDNRTEEDYNMMYSIPIELGILRKFKYTHDISTTDIIERIKKREN